MPLDAAAIGKVCRRDEIETADQLCRAEIERFRKAAAKGDLITVGCTQEAPLFSEIAAEFSYAPMRRKLKVVSGLMTSPFISSNG